MLDCFNEGFDDEESMAATCSQIPKVYLSFKDCEEVDLEQELASPKRRAYAQIDESESGVKLSDGEDSEASLTEAKEVAANPKTKELHGADSDIDC